MHHRIKALLAALSVALLTACGGGGGSGIGTVRVNLTDAPACGFDHVYITVDRIDFSKDDGVSWTSVPVNAGVSRLDLLEMQNGVLQTLATQPMAAGTYNQVRLVLKANGNQAPWANALVLSGTTTEAALTTPSAQQSGFKIKGPFTVEPDTLVDLDLDFNACKSVVTAGKSGKYNLKPVVRAVARVVSGSIDGTTTAGAAIYAEQNGEVIAGTVAQTAASSLGGVGYFRLSPLLNSADAGTYDIVIVPPASAVQSTAVIQQVPVTAGTVATGLGTVTPDATTLRTVSGKVYTNDNYPTAADLTISQTLSTSKTYVLATGASDANSGAYSFSLPSTGPQVGVYSATLPISLLVDSATAVAGHYGIAAVDDTGSTASSSANLSTADQAINLTLSP